MLSDKVSVSAHTNIFVCSYKRDAHMVTFPLKFLPGSTVTGVRQTWYIRQWDFMENFQIKGSFPPLDR